jgi:hypothetical protein
MNYFLVRVNTDDHPTRALAMADMAAIIEKRGYWKMSVRPDMPVGSAIIAAGSYGGQGLFLHGVVRKDWKAVKGGAEGNVVYQHKLGVQWEHVVYTRDPSARAQGFKLAGIGGETANTRSHTTINQQQYRTLMSFILLGEAVNPWEYDEEVAA